MPDLFRIITLGTDGRARIVEDLQVADRVYRERDSFTITPGGTRPRTAVSSARYGGSQTIGESRENSAIAASLVVKDATPEAAAMTVERLLERVHTGRRDLFIEWRPDGLARSAYSRITGPGTSAPAYRWIEWAGARRIVVPVAWPVEPLPQGLPCAIYERFVPPGEKMWGWSTLSLDQKGARAPWPAAFSPGVTVSDFDAGSFALDPLFSGFGRYAGALGNSAAAGAQYLVDPANNSSPLRANVKPGSYYAIRATVKVRVPWTNVAAAPLRLVARFSTINGQTPVLVQVASSPVNVDQYVAGAVIELAGVVQAPANAARVILGLEVTANGAVQGGARFGRFMVAEVPSMNTAPPVYGDGDTDLYRWQGAHYASPSVELSEAKLADYARPGGPASIERTTANGLLQRWQAGSGSGALVHLAREPVPDGEVIVGGVYKTAGAGAVGYERILAPGLRYSPHDGRYLWATLANGELVINYWDGFEGVQLASATLPGGGPASTLDRNVYLAFRVEGDQLTAEWYGTNLPDADRGNYLARARFGMDGPVAALMGADRVGYPMLRAQGMEAGGEVLTTRFDWSPYTYTDQVLPETIPLRQLPGTAPALLTPIIGMPGGPQIPSTMTFGDHFFGLFSWRSKQGRANLALNGDGKRAGGFSVLPTTPAATIERDHARGPAGEQASGVEPGLTRSVRVVSSATTESGAVLFETARTFKRGRAYTVEYWQLVGGPAGAAWTVELVQDPYVGATIYTGTPAQTTSWSKRSYTFRPTADLERVALRVRHLANLAGAEILVAGFTLYEGLPADVPIDREHTSGRGAFPPFGVIQAENRIDGNEAVVADTWATNLTKVKAVSAGVNSTRYLEFMVDPRLVSPADFAGDSVDVSVYGTFTVDVGAGVGAATLSARHEADGEGTARIYTREYGSAGRALMVTPSTGPTAMTTVGLGTLTLGTRGGRYVIRVAIPTGAVNGEGVALDALLLAPVLSTASSPTGKPFAGYPIFAPWQWEVIGQSFSTRSHERRVEPDGMAATVLTDGTAYPYGSIGGERIELDPLRGDGELLAWVAVAMPNPPDNGSGSSGRGMRGPTVAVRCDVTPRYRMMPA